MRSLSTDLAFRESTHFYARIQSNVKWFLFGEPLHIMALASQEPLANKHSIHWQGGLENNVKTSIASNSNTAVDSSTGAYPSTAVDSSTGAYPSTAVETRNSTDFIVPHAAFCPAVYPSHHPLCDSPDKQTLLLTAQVRTWWNVTRGCRAAGTVKLPVQSNVWTWHWLARTTPAPGAP